MSKKIIIIFVSILLLAAIPITLFVVQQRQEIRQQAAPATSLSFSPSQLTKAVDDEFNVDVMINTGVNAVQTVILDITYDASKLEVTGISLESSDFPVLLTSNDVYQDGHINEYIVSTADARYPFNGEGKVATISFRALAPTDTTSSLVFTDLSAAYSIDEGETNLLISTPPGTISITTPGQEPTDVPDVSPTDTTGNPTESITTTQGATVTGTVTSTVTGTVTSTVTGTVTSTVTTTVTQTQTPTPTPTQGPLNLTVTAPPNGGTTTDTTPTISGTAQAGTNITLTFNPGGLTGTTTANSSGTWSITPQNALGKGVYTLTITGTQQSTNTTQVINSTLTITSQTGTPTSTTIASNTTTNSTPRPTPTTQPNQSNPNTVPVTGSTETTLAIVALGIVLLLLGASLPFIMK